MGKGLITVFGGSGFVGQYVVRALCRAGYRVRVAVRRPHLAGDLKLAGDVGQVQLSQANVRDAGSVKAAMAGADGVVNLVGILFESGKQSFEKTQALGAGNVAEAAREAGIIRLVHISAIGADAGSKAAYAVTKAEAEASVGELVPTATILRPSIVFGTEDQFFNRFAQMATMSPFLPLVGGGKTRFQPVHVADVAQAVVAALGLPAAQGQTYELGGPRVYTFRELLDYIQKTASRKRLYLPLPFPVAGLVGLAFGALFRIPPMVGLFGGPPLTRAQVEMLKKDNVVDPRLPGFAELGITQLETVEAIVPTYLYRFRPQGQFSEPGGSN
jgi:NADH dehydrogenase